MKAVIFTASMAGQNRGIERVRQVLDLVAQRTGPSSWYGRLSEEMLASVRRALLARMPGRKAFVVCYEVAGFAHKRLRLLWCAGSRQHLGPDGQWIVARAGATTSRRHQDQIGAKDCVRNIVRAASAAGFSHDIGKDTTAFQAKLDRTGPVADAIRHEVISVQRLLASDPERWQPGPGGNLHWHHYLVLTHHRLPSYNRHDNTLDLRAQRHINDESDEPKCLQWFSQQPHNGALRDEDLRLQLPWPDVASFIYSRLALMLADHYVSSVAPSDKPRNALDGVVQRMTRLQENCARANRNQHLIGHMKAVGRLARSLGSRLLNGSWMTGMRGVACDRLRQRVANSGHFGWQAEAVKAAQDYAHSIPRGLGGLVLVMSSTGSGKTRACAAMAAAMSNTATTRLTVALGLRSLTLQTYRAYARELELTEADLDVTLGSKAYRDLHVADQQPLPDADKLSYVTVGADFSGIDDLIAPVKAQCRVGGDHRVLSVPVLVCTIDQIIDAADHRYVRWIKPWLRLQSSTAIIIDEIDGFGLEDTPALMRLIYFAAIAGTHVIISSATVYPAIAQRIIAAHEAGTRQRAAMLNIPYSAGALLVSNSLPTRETATADTISHLLTKQSHAASQQSTKRRTFALVGSEANNADEMRAAIAAQCLALHEENKLRADGCETYYSVGMVRLCHVKHVVAMARYLDEWGATRPHHRIGLIVYHSRNTMLARSYIEHHLDSMLRRHNTTPHQHPAIASFIHQAQRERKDAVIIVVTTLEEVGQDHDFDWAVIEPASARSIVQTCGRVRRHRYEAHDRINVAVLKHNFRYLDAKPDKRDRSPCFYRPGFEAQDGTGLPFKKPAEITSIEPCACLAPQQPSLGWYDNTSIDIYLSAHIDGWLNNNIMPVVANHYNQHKFRRQFAREILVTLDTDGSSYYTENDNKYNVGFLLNNTSILAATWADICKHFQLEEPSLEYRSLTIYEGTPLEFVDPLWGAVYMPRRQ